MIAAAQSANPEKRTTTEMLRPYIPLVTARVPTRPLSHGRCCFARKAEVGSLAASERAETIETYGMDQRVGMSVDQFPVTTRSAKDERDPQRPLLLG